MDPSSVYDEATRTLNGPLHPTSGFLRFVDAPTWEDGDRVLRLPVELEPDTDYALWIGAAWRPPKDTDGVPVDRYLLEFSTGPEAD